jgi:predicted transposase/invertase (TIGR01784 family)
MAKDDVIIKPTSDLFIASHWSNPKNEASLLSLLSGVMTDIGQPPIKKATVLNPFNIQDYPLDKQIRLDVRVEDEVGSLYNVEVQRYTHAAFFERMLYFWTETYGSQLKRGDDYTLLRPVRSIIITEFSVFPLLKRLHAVFELRSRENPEVLLSDHCQMHVLRLGDLQRNNLEGLDQFASDLQRWMQFWVFGSELEEDEMSTMLKDCPPVQATYEDFKRFTADPVMREKVKARERFLTEQQLMMNHSREEGREEGEAIGEKKAKIETANLMKQKGYSVAEITELTGLHPEEVEG